MDLTSIIGVVIGVVLIVFVGIGPKDLGNFWDPASVAIVLGGTLASVVASYPFSVLKATAKHIKILFQGKRYNVQALIDTLEEKANEQDDAFFRQGIMMIVDATEPEEVRSIMENELDIMDQRHEESLGIYEKAANYAPAFGMIGTLVGLVNMLNGMDIDAGASSDIGPAMATALITTFYGCVLAHLFLSPIAKKLRVRNEEELLYKQIMIEGLLAIQSGDNPKFLKEKLLTYLSYNDRSKLQDGEEGDGEKKAAKKSGGKRKKK